ncbi:thioredoxin family protein [Agromyces sp. SYSU T00266]|uniref:thioredoxin family protein n=1 Tax=Agromyces zhanjiangensis TaxID=3158562 RepID=UPI00339999AE
MAEHGDAAATGYAGTDLRVELLHLADCPHWEEALRLLRTVLDASGLRDVPIRVRAIDPGDGAGDPRFAGSPTILVDGADLFPSDRGGDALACRVYLTPDGIAGHPTRTQLEDAIRSRA